jgi:hypothetical protein
VHESLDRVAMIVRDDWQGAQSCGLKSVDGAFASFAVLALVGDFAEPLPGLAVDIVQIDELPEGPEVLPRIPDGALHFSFGEKRVLQTVLMVAHKFSPSRIHFTH